MSQALIFGSRAVGFNLIPDSWHLIPETEEGDSPKASRKESPPQQNQPTSFPAISPHPLPPSRGFATCHLPRRGRQPKAFLLRKVARRRRVGRSHRRNKDSQPHSPPFLRTHSLRHAAPPRDTSLTEGGQTPPPSRREASQNTSLLPLREKGVAERPDEGSPAPAGVCSSFIPSCGSRLGYKRADIIRLNARRNIIGGTMSIRLSSIRPLRICPALCNCTEFDAPALEADSWAVYAIEGFLTSWPSGL
jgi:hypothetical protein